VFCVGKLYTYIVVNFVRFSFKLLFSSVCVECVVLCYLLKFSSIIWCLLFSVV
jgi:hypothetical protein